MLKMEGLLELIHNIPTVLQYVVPGYIFIAIFRFITSKKMTHVVHVVAACVISFVLVTLLRLIGQIPFLQFIENNSIVTISLAIGLSTIISLVVSLIFVSKRFSRITQTTLGKSPHDSLWRVMIPKNYGATLKVNLKNAPYYIIGVLVEYEENGNDSWFCLSQYSLYKVGTTKEIDNHGEIADSFITFCLSDAESIQILRKKVVKRNKSDRD